MSNQDAKETNDITKGLKQDQLVAKLVPDPENHEPAIQQVGWLGKGIKEGSWRLYLTPQLNEYIQFSEADVIHSQPLDISKSSLGGTTVWLKAGTPLAYTQVVKRTVQADFLSGGITSNYMAGSAPSLVNPRARKMVAGASRGYQCSINRHIPACQMPSEACPINSIDTGCGTGAICPTGAFVCGASAGCTGGTECSIGCPQPAPDSFNPCYTEAAYGCA